MSTCLAVFGLVTRLAWAQPDWAASRLPASTELYLETRPQLHLSSGPPLLQRLERSPLLRVVSGWLPVQPEQRRELASLLSWDGRLVLALCREGSVSPFQVYYEAHQRRDRVRQLRYEAEMAFVGVNQYRKYQKKFPPNVAALQAKGYYNGEVPDGAELTLQREGKRVTVVGHWQGDEVRWPDPDWDGESLRPMLPGVLAAVGVSDTEALKTRLQQWDEQFEQLAFEGDHWTVAWDQVLKIQIYVRPDWVVLTNAPGVAQAFLSSSPSPSSLASNPRFAEQCRRIRDQHSELLAFADVQDVLTTTPALPAEATQRVLFRSVGAASGRRLEGRLLTIHQEAFLQWDGGGTPLLSPLSAVPLASRVPQDCEQVAWFNVSALVRQADRLGGEVPLLGSAFQHFWSMLEQRLGTPLERKALAKGARIYAYREAVDVYARELQALAAMFGPLLGAPVPDSTGDAGAPVLLVLETDDASLARQMHETVNASLGENPVRRTVEGVSYLARSDGGRAVATLDTTEIVASGYTERLLPAVANAYVGRAPGLAATPAFQRFEEGRQGELLFYYHTKVDRHTSLLKWIFLQLGSDFRPEAEAIGRLKDAHVSAEVVSGGIRLRGETYSDGVAPPARRMENE